MDRKKIEEYIQFAIEKEIEAYEFYLKCSELTDKASLKQTFLDYAAEEKKHEQLLSEFTPETVAERELHEQQDLKIADFFEDMDFHPGMSMQEILIMAMKREDSAYRMYTILAEKGSGADPAAEKLFRLLAQEELKHKNYFQREYDDHILRDN
ncbi:ferritin family protein [bacterium]|nr:ferritin family protein [bacterium]